MNARGKAIFLMTECNQSAFSFEAHFSRQVEARFDRRQMTTEGGGLLLGATVVSVLCGDAKADVTGNELRVSTTGQTLSFFVLN